MAALRDESHLGGGRSQTGLSVAFIVVGLALGALGEDTQQLLSGALRGTALRPFLALQEGLALARTRAGEVDVLMSRLDSVSAILTRQAALAEENTTLRGLLDLAERLGPGFASATVVRPGTPGSESMFLLDLGAEDGVVAGAPVLSPGGLVGAVRDVGASSAVAMDWTHPDFRASGMVVGTEMYGIVENRRGAFREEDRLVLTGTAYNEEAPDGSAVVTSGLGGIYPRGVPIGTVDGVADFEGSWRKSYWLRPSVLPGEVTHVIVPVVAGADTVIAWPSSSAVAEPAGTSPGEEVDEPPADSTGLPATEPGTDGTG